jgi:hypothetical protein
MGKPCDAAISIDSPDAWNGKVGQLILLTYHKACSFLAPEESETRPLASNGA